MLKKKKAARIIIAFIMALSLLPIRPVSADASQSGSADASQSGLVDTAKLGNTNTNKPVVTTANEVQYIEKDGKRTGIASFSIDPYYYYNLGLDIPSNSKTGSGMVLNTSKLYEICQKDIFPKWSRIAEEVFRDQASQIVTIEGSGMMSSDPSAKNSFDKHFSYNKSGVGRDYQGYDWSVSNLSRNLSSTMALHQGEQNYDECRTTGITVINSLAHARWLMGQELRNCSDDDNNTVNDFLANQYRGTGNSRFRLPALDNENSGSGFANIVTCVNRAGRSADYDYVSFGLAVYDFKVVPIAAENLKYISPADKDEGAKDILDGGKGNFDWDDQVGVSFRQEDTSGIVANLSNPTSNEMTTDTQLEETSTVETSLTKEETKERSHTVSVGGEVNMGYVIDCVPRFTFNTNYEWSDLWSTTQSSTETKAVSVTKGMSSEVTLKPYTVASVKQYNSRSTARLRYQQPGVISYKVAVFSMSGDYFNGWACGGIEPSQYDKAWMSVIFDGSENEAESGCAALDSLYARAIINPNAEGYDAGKGNYTSWCDKGCFQRSYKINWNSINNLIDREYQEEYRLPCKKTVSSNKLHEMACEIPILEEATIMDSRQNVITSEQVNYMASHSLASVEMENGNKRIRLSPEDTFYLDTLKFKGYNAEGGEFYGFKPSWCQWALFKGDQIVEDGGPDDENDETGKVTIGAFTLCTDELIQAQYVETDHTEESSESVNLKLVIDTNAIICSNQELAAGKAKMSEDDIKGVKTPVIELVLKKSAGAAKISASGSYTGLVSDPINLNDELEAEAVSNSEEEDAAPVYWEAKDDQGLLVQENGNCDFASAGTYEVRAYSLSPEGEENRIYSDWLTLEVRDPSVLTEVSFDHEALHKDKRMITRDKLSYVLNLEDYLIFKDQYGEEMKLYRYDEAEGSIKKLVPDIHFDYSGDQLAYIDGAGKMTISRPGKYTVSAAIWDEEGNDLGYDIKPAEITVTGDIWLNKISFNTPKISQYYNITMKDLNEAEVVENLEEYIDYLDQNGQPWTGAKPTVHFSINAEDDEAEIKDGNLYIYKPGSYGLTLYAEAYSYIDLTPVIVSEPSTEGVTDTSRLVINTNNPDSVDLNDSEAVSGINLTRCVDYTTSYAGKWEGYKPELSFTLDDSVKTGNIEKRSMVIDEDTGEKLDYDAFIASEPGTYLVHVTAVNSSEYSKKIDDIEITITGQGKEEEKVEKKDQPLKIKKTAKKINYKKLARKKKTVSPLKVTGAKGTVTYKKVSVNKKKYAGRFQVNRKTGKITVKKKTRKGTYKIKIKLTAGETAAYKPYEKTVTVKVMIK